MVGWFTSCLIYVLCVCLHIHVGVSNTYCVVLFTMLSVSVIALSVFSICDSFIYHVDVLLTS